MFLPFWKLRYSQIFQENLPSDPLPLLSSLIDYPIFLFFFFYYHYTFKLFMLLYLWWNILSSFQSLLLSVSKHLEIRDFIFSAPSTIIGTEYILMLAGKWTIFTGCSQSVYLFGSCFFTIYMITENVVY